MFKDSISTFPYSSYKMKNLLRTGLFCVGRILAGAALTAGSLISPAAAQVVLDGRFRAAEMGPQSGLYKSAGQYTRPHTDNTGFGNWGLLEAYVTSSATKLYIGVRGTVEPNGNSFQVLLDLPNANGPQVLPLINSGKGTSFDNFGATLDMQADVGVALRASTTLFNTYNIEYVDYAQTGNLRTGLLHQIRHFLAPPS